MVEAWPTPTELFQESSNGAQEPSVQPSVIIWQKPDAGFSLRVGKPYKQPDHPLTPTLDKKEEGGDGFVIDRVVFLREHIHTMTTGFAYTETRFVDDVKPSGCPS